MSGEFKITADDIAALRTANAVTFHYYEKRGFIRADADRAIGGAFRVYSAREQRLFPLADRQERSREISVDTRMAGYADDAGIGWRLDNSPHASAFHVISSAQFNDDWLTIASLLKVGDTLTLSWMADNNTETVTESGLHADELRLLVGRNGRTMSFLIEHAVRRDNSARLIRRHG